MSIRSLTRFNDRSMIPPAYCRFLYQYSWEALGLVRSKNHDTIFSSFVAKEGVATELHSDLPMAPADPLHTISLT